jgi:hypothetical protein
MISEQLTNDEEVKKVYLEKISAEVRRCWQDVKMMNRRPFLRQTLI